MDKEFKNKIDELIDTLNSFYSNLEKIEAELIDIRLEIFELINKIEEHLEQLKK